MGEEFPTEYPQQTEYGGESGDGYNTTTGSGSGSSSTTTGGTGGSLAQIFGQGSSLLSRMLGSNMTDTKPKAEEKDPKNPTPVAAPVAASSVNNAQIKPWMWYVGGAVFGVFIVGGIIWYKKYSS
jgi:hypothetical protein